MINIVETVNYVKKDFFEYIIVPLRVVGPNVGIGRNISRV